LLVELSTLAASNQRGTDYVLDNPDLVVASHDIDATRRLFETRTRWPGTRHARLAIASVLSGDLSNACRHVVGFKEWSRHFYRQNNGYRRDRGGPERIDNASIALCLIAQDRARDAANFMNGWYDWYAYEIAENVFMLLDQAQNMEAIPAANISRFLVMLKLQPGVLAAAISFIELDKALCRRLIGQLAKVCKKKNVIETNKEYQSERNYRIEDGLLKAAAIAISIKMFDEAYMIVVSTPNERPRLWSLTDRFSNLEVFPFLSVLRFSLQLSVDRLRSVVYYHGNSLSLVNVFRVA